MIATVSGTEGEFPRGTALDVIYAVIIIEGLVNGHGNA